MIRQVNPESDAGVITQIYNYYISSTTISFETETISVEEMKLRITQISTDFPYLVYENHKGEVIGYCYAHLWKERAAYHLTLETTIYLRRDCAQNGVGTALMRELIKQCSQRGYKSLIACITADNIPSINFHSKLGFIKVSHFKNVGIKFGNMLDVVDFQLSL